MATMIQKSSVPENPRSVSQALTADNAEEAAHADYHGLELPIRVEEDVVDLAKRLVLTIVDRGAKEGAGEHLLGLLRVDEAKLTGGTRAIGGSSGRSRRRSARGLSAWALSAAPP